MRVRVWMRVGVSVRLYERVRVYKREWCVCVVVHVRLRVCVKHWVPVACGDSMGSCLPVSARGALHWRCFVVLGSHKGVASGERRA